MVSVHQPYTSKTFLLAILIVPLFLPFLMTGEAIADAPGHPNPFQREGSFAPSIQALATTQDGTIYAGSFGLGVFLSKDHGNTWTSINKGMGDRFILCLTADQKGRVYAGTVRGGIFRTRDDGASWEAISHGLKRVEVKSLLAHPRGIYAGTGRGVYQWQEDAQTWTVVAKGLDQTLVSSLVMMNNQRLFAGTAGQGVQWLDTTQPGTATWERVNTQFIDAKEHLRHNHIRILSRSRNDALFVGTQDGGIYRSVDRGETWHTFGRSLPNDSIRGIVSTNGGVFVATGRGIYKTSLQNTKWKAVNTGLTELAIQVMIMTPQGDLYAGTSAGAFRSQDHGQHWVNVSEGLGTQFSMPRPYF